MCSQCCGWLTHCACGASLKRKNTALSVECTLAVILYNGDTWNAMSHIFKLSYYLRTRQLKVLHGAIQTTDCIIIIINEGVSGKRRCMSHFYQRCVFAVLDQGTYLGLPINC